MRRREFITLVGGATASWPFGARAQQPEQMRRIGGLMGFADNDLEAKAWVSSFIQGLKELNWEEGSNVHFDYRWTVGAPERGQIFAAELVASNPAVILASNTVTLAALRQATTTIPIVFVNVSDPVGGGFVQSFARPGG